MDAPGEFPKERFERLKANFFPHDSLLRRKIPYFDSLKSGRREDAADSFGKFRPVVADLLAEYGIDNPELADRVALFGSVQERSGFEQGILFVHENAHVTTQAEADRQRSFMMNSVGNIN